MNSLLPASPPGTRTWEAGKTHHGGGNSLDCGVIERRFRENQGTT